MQRTRGKRDLNLGSQPVISKVSNAPGRDGAKSMLSSDAKIRGHMINLKKIMMSNLQEHMKSLTSSLIRDNVVIFYTGIDAVNLHFSNKATHTGFIELGLTIRTASESDVVAKTSIPLQTRLQTSMKIAMDIILKNFNEFMTQLAGNPSCILTHEILADCKADGEKDGNYFVLGGSGERQTVDFRLNGGTQPFFELRYVANASPLFEKYGVFYSTLKMIASDIKTGMAKYGTSDWAFRDSTLQEALTRGGLTLTHWTIYSLLRECFPAIAMRKMKVREAVVSMIELNVGRTASQREANQLKSELYQELDDYQNDAALTNMLTFAVFFGRCVAIGLLPDQEEFQETLDNTYNAAILREIRVVMLSK